MDDVSREFRMIPGTYQNPPFSKPWAIAQAFCSKSPDFGAHTDHTTNLEILLKGRFRWWLPVLVLNSRFQLETRDFFSEEDFATETKETIFDGANKVKY